MHRQAASGHPNEVRMANIARMTVLALFLAVVPCAAQVEDQAGLFNEETKRQAESRIKLIREQTGKQVAVWTLKELPKERAAKINLDDAGQRKQLFEELIEEHVKKLE